MVSPYGTFEICRKTKLFDVFQRRQLEALLFNIEILSFSNFEILSYTLGPSVGPESNLNVYLNVKSSILYWQCHAGVCLTTLHFYSRGVAVSKLGPSVQTADVALRTDLDP